jgi:5-methylcytosine-specific restriction endonuclease McrA
MQKHTKIYLKGCGYVSTDFIPSELSYQRAVDVHHIISRGKGGEDRLENLMAVTRGEHEEFGDKKEWIYFLLARHYEFLTKKGAEYSKEWFDKQFTKYREIL